VRDIEIRLKRLEAIAGIRKQEVILPPGQRAELMRELRQHAEAITGRALTDKEFNLRVKELSRERGF
jgi:hypothetical protein